MHADPARALEVMGGIAVVYDGVAAAVTFRGSGANPAALKAKCMLPLDLSVTVVAGLAGRYLGECAPALGRNYSGLAISLAVYQRHTCATENSTQILNARNLHSSWSYDLTRSKAPPDRDGRAASRPSSKARAGS